MNINYQKIIELVLNTIEIILNSEKASQVTVKGLADYVTQVDLSVQSYLVNALSAEYPEIQFLGEEGCQSTLDWSRPVWILDPVDGTTNLIHDYQNSCVALGLWDGAQMVFGCIYNPFHHELYHAIRGNGAHLNGRRIFVSDRAALSNSLILIGTSPYEKDRADEVFDKIKKVYLASEDIRRSGSAALDFCAVACGRADGYFEYNLKPWDFAAGSVILEEAGGRFTNVNGDAVFPGENSDIICTNGFIHQELTTTLNEPV